MSEVLSGRLPTGARLYLKSLLERSPAALRREVVLALASTFPADERAAVAAQIDRQRMDDPSGLDAALRSFLDNASSEGAFALTEALRERSLETQASVDHVLQVYGSHAEALQAAGADLSEAHVLELGPGHSLLGALLLVAWGAERYAAVDAFPIDATNAARVAALRARFAAPTPWPIHQPELARRGAELLERFDSCYVPAGESVEWLPERVRLDCPCDAADLPHAEGSFQIVLSNAVLEHVRDLGGVARECARVLAPGGFALHQIDFRDHRDFSRPREFLRCSRQEWEAICAADPTAYDYTNRIRLGEARQTLLASGLELVSCELDQRAPLAPGERASFDPEFRDLDDESLEALSACLILRKPPPES